MPTPGQIKKIHALKGKLSLDDATYRATLAGYGVTSSVKLSIEKADTLIADLEEKAVASGVWEKRDKVGRRLGEDPQAMKIQALWAQLHQAGKVETNSAKALLAYVKRMSGKDALKWCTSFEKGRIIEALKAWLER
jgi:phage gp16-like protein